MKVLVKCNFIFSFTNCKVQNAYCLRNQLKVIKFLNTLCSTFFTNAVFLDVVKYNYVLSVISGFLSSSDASNIQTFCLSEAAIILSFRYGQLYEVFWYKLYVKLNRNIGIPTFTVRIASFSQKERNFATGVCVCV